MNRIEKKILCKEFLYDQEVVLKYKITYPFMICSEWERGKAVFNQYNQQEVFRLEKYIQEELYPLAVETYRYNKENNYPIMVFEVIREYEITYNEEQVISLYADEYTYTGGANGQTIRTSQNWNLCQACQIPLQEFGNGNPMFFVEVIKQINQQIEEIIKTEPSTYFEDYCQLVLQYFDPNHYYITDSGIVIFFELYEIAPHSTGIPNFLIKI